MFPSDTACFRARKLLFPFLASFILLFSAEIKAQSLVVGVEAGTLFEPVEQSSSGELSGETSIEANGWTVGVFGTLKIAGPLAFHAELLYSTYNGIESSASWAESGTPIQADIFALPVSLRLQFGKEGLVPFVYAGTTLGVVAEAFDPQNMGERSATTIAKVKKERGDMSATGDLGAGVIIPMTPSFDFRFEVRSSWDMVGIDPIRSDSWQFGRAIGLVGANVRLF